MLFIMKKIKFNFFCCEPYVEKMRKFITKAIIILTTKIVI